MSVLAHPGLPEFDYIKPETAVSASKFLAEHEGEARPLLGGTDIFVRMRDGFWQDKYLVDVKGLAGMDTIAYNPESGLTIGAAVTMNRVIAHPDVRQFYPLLAEAADSVASYQLRNRATIVGNICNASPAGDTIGACLLLNGILNVHGVDGPRQEPLSTFFLGPGKTVLKAGDIAISIQFPLPPEGLVGKYIKHGRNKASDLALVGVTAVGYPHAASASGYQFKLALASVAPVPLAVNGDFTAALADAPITPESIIQAAQAAMDACTPIDDIRSGARYRSYMVRNLTKQAVTEIWQKLQ